jgi:hypothetical protein
MTFFSMENETQTDFLTPFEEGRDVSCWLVGEN